MTERCWPKKRDRMCDCASRTAAPCRHIAAAAGHRENRRSGPPQTSRPAPRALFDVGGAVHRFDLDCEQMLRRVGRARHCARHADRPAAGTKARVLWLLVRWFVLRWLIGELRPCGVGRGVQAQRLISPHAGQRAVQTAQQQTGVATQAQHAEALLLASCRSSSLVPEYSAMFSGGAGLHL